MANYKKIFLAHYKAKLPILIWGSSGYGKTSAVKSFAEEAGFDLETIHAQYIDPMALFIPSTAEMKTLGYVKYYPSDFLFKIFNAKKPTILFLDELTRAREDTFNILTELLLDRRVFGYPVPNHVLMIGASNFSEEDSGVREMPDAVAQRLTHITHSPGPDAAFANLRSPLAKAALKRNPKILQKPGSFDIYTRLRACPRQIDACAALAAAGLRGLELRDCCRGRLGLEAGTAYAFSLESVLLGESGKLPDLISEGVFAQISAFEQKSVIDVAEWLGVQAKSADNAKLVADYLLRHAKPETCRAIQQRRFSFTYKTQPVDAFGKPFTIRLKDDKIEVLKELTHWTWYAGKLGKLTAR